ncbi:uncharacterized protein LOC108664508 [Hyalella azteca]|uniref:Uncharacterized protein LOC108664508 n=1 Tax=Hyalella azteca TaxID=294128 RepID=A0A8B7MYE4_HYAAZ|nr:uncharacterized protein LOC108664508 [Hyalella azteca]
MDSLCAAKWLLVVASLMSSTSVSGQHKLLFPARPRLQKLFGSIHPQFSSMVGHSADERSSLATSAEDEPAPRTDDISFPASSPFYKARVQEGNNALRLPSTCYGSCTYKDDHFVNTTHPDWLDSFHRVRFEHTFMNEADKNSRSFRSRSVSDDGVRPNTYLPWGDAKIRRSRGSLRFIDPKYPNEQAFVRPSVDERIRSSRLVSGTASAPHSHYQRSSFNVTSLSHDKAAGALFALNDQSKYINNEQWNILHEPRDHLQAPKEFVHNVLSLTSPIEDLTSTAVPLVAQSLPYRRRRTLSTFPRMSSGNRHLNRRRNRKRNRTEGKRKRHFNNIAEIIEAQRQESNNDSHKNDIALDQYYEPPSREGSIEIKNRSIPIHYSTRGRSVTKRLVDDEQNGDAYFDASLLGRAVDQFEQPSGTNGFFADPSQLSGISDFVNRPFIDFGAPYKAKHFSSSFPNTGQVHHSTVYADSYTHKPVKLITSSYVEPSVYQPQVLPKSSSSFTYEPQSQNYSPKGSHEPATEHHTSYKGPYSYRFGYGVKSKYHGTRFQHKEQRHGKTVSGEYRVHLPDGRVQIVSYTADEKGYRPVVTYAHPEGGAANSGTAHHKSRSLSHSQFNTYHR